MKESNQEKIFRQVFMKKFLEKISRQIFTKNKPEKILQDTSHTKKNPEKNYQESNR